jgi:hypothetical protein
MSFILAVTIRLTILASYPANCGGHSLPVRHADAWSAPSYFYFTRNIVDIFLQIFYFDFYRKVVSYERQSGC